MGYFIYDNRIKTEIEDRALTHLQLVMMSKLRRGEPFGFSWKEDASIGDGRVTVWVSPSSALVFKFVGSRPPKINQHWADALAYTASSSTGLYLVHEPNEGSPAFDPNYARA